MRPQQVAHGVLIQVLQTQGLEEIKPARPSDGAGQGPPAILPTKTSQAWETQLRTACLLCHSQTPWGETILFFTAERPGGSPSDRDYLGR